jgi:hypothetical protein
MQFAVTSCDRDTPALKSSPEAENGGDVVRKRTCKAGTHVEVKKLISVRCGQSFNSSTQHKLKGKVGCEQLKDYGLKIGAHRKLTFSLALRCRRGLRSYTKQKLKEKETWENADQKHWRI